jgi:hypothetical protein
MRERMRKLGWYNDLIELSTKRKVSENWKKRRKSWDGVGKFVV